MPPLRGGAALERLLGPGHQMKHVLVVVDHMDIADAAARQGDDLLDGDLEEFLLREVQGNLGELEQRVEALLVHAAGLLLPAPVADVAHQGQVQIPPLDLDLADADLHGQQGAVLVPIEGLEEGPSPRIDLPRHERPLGGRQMVQLHRQELVSGIAEQGLRPCVGFKDAKPLVDHEDGVVGLAHQRREAFREVQPLALRGQLSREGLRIVPRGPIQQAKDGQQRQYHAHPDDEGDVLYQRGERLVLVDLDEEVPLRLADVARLGVDHLASVVPPAQEAFDAAHGEGGGALVVQAGFPQPQHGARLETELVEDDVFVPLAADQHALPRIARPGPLLDDRLDETVRREMDDEGAEPVSRPGRERDRQIKVRFADRLREMEG